MQYGDPIQDVLKWTKISLKAILSGKRAPIDNDDPSQAWLFDMVRNMYSAHVIGASPPHYIKSQGEYRFKSYLHHAETDIHPLCDPLVRQDRVIREGLPSNFTNLHVLGSSWSLRNKSAHKKLPNGIDNFVAAKSDFWGLLELVDLALWNLKHPNDKKQIIVQDEKYFAPFLKQFNPYEVGIEHITNNASGSVEYLINQGVNINHAIEITPPPFDIKPGATIFLGTNDGDKVAVDSAILREAGYDCRVKPASSLLSYKEAKEKKVTLEGNNREKAQEFFHDFAKMLRKIGNSDIKRGEKKYRKFLKENKVDPENSFFVADDRGGSFADQSVFESSKFDGALHKMTSSPMPGPEYKHLENAMHGKLALFGTVHNILKKREKETGKPADFRLYNHANFVMARLFQDDYENPEIISTQGHEVSEILHEPEPSIDKLSELRPEHMCRPYLENDEGVLELSQLSQQEIQETGGMYIERNSSMAKGLLAMAQVVSMPKRTVNIYLSQEFNNQNMVIMTEQHLLPYRSNELNKVAGFLQEKSMIVPDNIADVRELVDVQDKWVEKADGFLFIGEPEGDDHLQSLLDYAVVSVLVGKNVKEPDIAFKPVVILDQSAEKPRQKLQLDMIDKLKGLGAHRLYEGNSYYIVSSLEEAHQVFLEHSAKDNRIMHYPFAKGDIENEIGLWTPEFPALQGVYRRGVFCAAAAQNADHWRDASDIPEEWNMAGIHTVSGAGDDTMMYEVPLAAKRANERRAVNGLSPVQTIGYQAHHIMTIEGAPIDLLDEFKDYPDIHRRMTALVWVPDDMTVLLGHFGTVQEALVSKLLYDLDHPAAFGNDGEPKQLLIHDKVIEVGEENIRYYDHIGLLDMLEGHPNMVVAQDRDVVAQYGIDRYEQWKQNNAPYIDNYYHIDIS